jgi:glycosyltransferase involved in cell wall biosynthesis
LTLITVIIPCFNEENSIVTLINAVQSSLESSQHEIIVVDDASSDRTRERLEALLTDSTISLTIHPKNKGKGAAIRTGISRCKGDIVIIQDADLEYNPAEYSKMLTPILEDKADVVYGSRFRSGEASRVLYYWHSLGNMLLTSLSNMFTNLNLTDMETCYKVFRREVLDQIEIEENRFGFEPEITAKISKIRPRIRIFEVGISYYGRTYEEGKKITWKDGVSAIYAILKYNLFR